MTATSALADSPHFIFATNSVDTSNGALATSFKDAGLGTGVTSIAITLKADATATYQCYNKAGNKPEGKPKSFGPTGVSASRTSRCATGRPPAPWRQARSVRGPSATRLGRSCSWMG
jgi:hypothetical protein